MEKLSEKQKITIRAKRFIPTVKDLKNFLKTVHLNLHLLLEILIWLNLIELSFWDPQWKYIDIGGGEIKNTLVSVNITISKASESIIFFIG